MRRHKIRHRVRVCRLIPVDLQNRRINTEGIKDGGEAAPPQVEKMNFKHVASTLLLLLFLQLKLKEISNAQKEVLTRQKVLDPFYKMRKAKSKAAEPISIPT
ncbi:Hypothetical predicted protein [Xyrichtys novacula]|uniref:Uncharacterized protein n=1 Tax=Xyrichtys novacula TaxID=13765 RepID=A0AAV1FEQ3_XYRNO|nr:Hypothetical predicted protein [Xyrichtys novacula]